MRNAIGDIENRKFRKALTTRNVVVLYQYCERSVVWPNFLSHLKIPSALGFHASRLQKIIGSDHNVVGIESLPKFVELPSIPHVPLKILWNPKSQR